MSKQEIWFIINPHSGTDKNKGFLEQLIEHKIDNQKFNYKIKLTEFAGHATEITKNALENKVSIVVAVGGDGTVNEVAKVLINTKVSLGIIPRGSGNGLARELGISLNPEKAIEQINDQIGHKIDVGFINNIPFFCTAGIGFDAQCAEVFAKGGNKRGLINYIKTAFKEFWKFKPLPITFGGNDFDIFSMTFANARQFGNNAYIAPQAYINDGYLDCIIVEPLSMWSAPILISQLFSKTLNQSSKVESYRGTKFSVKSENNFLIHFDGEPLRLNSKALTISVSASCLNVIF